MNEKAAMTTANSPAKSLDSARILKILLYIAGIAVASLVITSTSSNSFSQFLPSLGYASFFGFNKQVSPSKHPALVHDEHYELRKVLKAAAMEDNTVILTTLNDAWAEPNSIFDLFLESFRIGNNTAQLVKHILVIAVDEKAYIRCQATKLHCYYLKSKSKYSPEELAKLAKFLSPIYLEMMWERETFLQTILSLGYNFVFSDTDVMWLRDPFPHFSPDVDFQSSCDRFNNKPFDRRNGINNGFNFARSNNRSIEFYRFWVASRWMYPGEHEQAVFDRIKVGRYVNQIGFTMRFLDTEHFSGYCHPSKDFDQVVTMHANCCVGLEKKIADLKSTLADWKLYLSSLTNPSIQRPRRWRAPRECRR